MLKTWIPEEIPEKEELKKLDCVEAGEKLYQQQMKLKEHKLPVLVLFEGWGASGKGTTIGRVIKYIDPRFFKVATMSKPTEDELRRPFLYRYFNQIPEAGKLTCSGFWLDGADLQRLSERSGRRGLCKADRQHETFRATAHRQRLSGSEIFHAD